jgi:hypothetical protein
MRSTLLLAVCALTLASTAAAFEGVLELDVSVEGKTSRGRATLGEGGDLRLDVTVPVAGESLHTSLIVLGSNDDVLIQATQATRTFERRRLSASIVEPERFSVAPAGTREITGRQAKGFLVTDSKSGDRFSVWLDPSFGDLALLDRIHQSLRPDAGGLGAALAQAGGKGAPLWLRWERRHGGVVRLEVVKVEARPVPREAFDLPAGFRDITGVGGAGLQQLLGR